MHTSMTAHTTTYATVGMDYDIVEEDRSIALENPTINPSSPIVSLLTHVDPDLDHDEWIRIILAIHELTDGRADGFDLAIEWSNKSVFVRDDEFISATWGYAGDGPY